MRCCAVEASKLGFRMTLPWFSAVPFLAIQSQTSVPVLRSSVSEPLIWKTNASQLYPGQLLLFRRRSCNCCLNSDSFRGSDRSPATRVYVKGLARSTTEGSLMKAFSKFGEITRVRIITDKKSKQSLGFGHVWFTTEESAELAVKEMNGKFFDGRFVVVMIARLGPSELRRKAVPYKF